MIYTVTFNPALDYTVTLPHLETGLVNRTESETIYPGGKGINVSIMLRHLGISSKALGFTAGFTGDMLEQLTRAEGCDTDFIRLPEGNTRINVKIKSQTETDINGQGPAIPKEALDSLFHRLDALSDGDMLVLAGSIPSTLPDDMYERILKRLRSLGKSILVTADATGDLLLRLLPYRPFLIKPNHHELGELFGETLRSPAEIVSRAQRLQEMGARNVLVSMAGEGAVLLDETGTVHHSLPPRGTVVNSVGAGDSMVAGFLAGWTERGNYVHAFRMGLCSGSASAFQPGIASREDVEHLMETMAF